MSINHISKSVGMIVLLCDRGSPGELHAVMGG